MQGLLEHLQELVTCLADHRDEWDCSVVEIFNGPLRDIFPTEWMVALQASRTSDLLHIPAGMIKDEWPLSLQSFISTAHRLSLKRDPTTALPLSFPDTSPPNLNTETPPPDANPLQSQHGVLQLAEAYEAPQNAPGPVAGFPPGTPPPGQGQKDPPESVELDHVVAQGMSPKKRHEVAALAALVAKVAKEAGATTVIDIGAGQGYLSNVLYYQYGLDVIAVDAAPGHAGVMQKRSGSISKYFRNLRRKARETKLATSNSIPPHNDNGLFQEEPAEGLGFDTISHGNETGGARKGRSRRQRDDVRESGRTSATEDGLLEGPIAVTSKIDFGNAGAVLEKLRLELARIGDGHEKRGAEHLLDGPVVLAGLHACGDLSASMLRTFAACPSVKAVVVVSCCYNLVTEASSEPPSGNSPNPTGRPNPNLRASVRGPSDSLRNGPSESGGHSSPSPQHGSSGNVRNPSDRPECDPCTDKREPFARPKNSSSESGRKRLDAMQNGQSGSLPTTSDTIENGRSQNSQKPSACGNSALPGPPQTPQSLHPDIQEDTSALESCPGCCSEPGDASRKPSGLVGPSSGACSHQRYGFPLSAAVKATGFGGLGINGRMLACQSADRWRAQSEAGFADVITKHTLRAAFQTLLARHFPAVWATKPVLGKQKKRPVSGTPVSAAPLSATPVSETPVSGPLVSEAPASEPPINGCSVNEETSSARVAKGVEGSKHETSVACAGERKASQNGANIRKSGSGAENRDASPGVHSECRPELANDRLKEERSSHVGSSPSSIVKIGPSDTDLISDHTLPSSLGPSSKRTDSAGQATPVAAEAGPLETSFRASSRVYEDERSSPERASERARFVEFARDSLQRLGLPEVSENEIGDVWESLRSSKDLVGPFWTLRTAMAGPLESLILLDRFMYMNECLEGTSASLPEQGKLYTGSLGKGQRSTASKGGVRMFPLFDPEISPRNVVIVGQQE
ncbi:S-adenosyl-L-methionine-dependent methyltransferases superfamily protein [Klebsormidium nitens]|uniref:S-adenosyl-L-methionine-dependent methyltransferases superfamily protein n=1 Tax=Klebsormidium nitens TaxID=105231 RepID=A0A1Y1IBG0_KLENI|nr:S-adenosyl-L-methionine-dependent methyltransferases superfamily protein [Klebsormidium nitens]|eukprot:GAQ86046.1 S-adenosyl-L-methionine-dependent methyltransferases superfamily protein [Klebsormidium nitens]